jgi:tRNA(Ile)-lysidine synthase
LADLPSWVKAYAVQEGLFRPGDRVLAAVSGGPDSVALLHLLYQLRQDLGLELAVAHFDHGLRGSDSEEDAAFVARLARDLALRYHRGEGRVKELAQAERISLQMAARRLRLDFLRQTCRSQGYTKLALGHTADDQVELFFLRLLRGAGPEGLKGMWPATPEGLVRPLLALGKDTLVAWLHQEGLPYRQDLSNLDRRYLRNRFRLDLLPGLLRFNPRLREAVWRTQALLQEEERLLAQETARAWEAVARPLAPEVFALALPGLLGLPPGLQNRVLRAAVGKLAGGREITSAQVAALQALARGEKSGGQLSLGEVRVARAGQELHVFRNLPAPPPGSVTLLPATLVSLQKTENRKPETVLFPEGWGWRLRCLPGPPPDSRPPSRLTAWLDLDRLEFPLKVRHLQPGDRFWPLGAPAAKKLQDFLVDNKIPRWLRPHLPLVESGRTIVWVAGLRIAESARLTPETKSLLELEATPLTPGTQTIWQTLQACRG